MIITSKKQKTRSHDVPDRSEIDRYSLCSGVRSHVALEVAAVRKSLLAHGAREGLLTRVYPRVK